MGKAKYKNNMFDDLFSKFDLSDVPEYVEPTKPEKSVEDVGVESDGIEQEYVRVIALDETGKFEHLWDDNSDSIDVRCIGGVYVDLPLGTGDGINDRVDNSVRNELRKINEYLRDSINAFNNTSSEYHVVMPDSLHLSNILLKNTSTGEAYYTYTNAGGNSEKDSSEERKKVRNKFKRFIEGRVLDFIKESKYVIYSYVLSKDQIDIGRVNKSNLIDYRVGANLYEEMVIKAIENIVFYDSTRTVDNISLRMATRIFNPNSEESVLYDVSKKGDRFTGYITNTNFIKTALMHKIASDKSDNCIYSTFAVESIDYKKAQGLSDGAWEERQILLSFHYFADIVCGVLRQRYGYDNNGVLKYGFEKDNYEQSMVDKSYELVDEGFNIRFISEPDKMYNRMFDYMYSGELVNYYSFRYDFERRIRDKDKKISRVSQFYYDTLLPALDKKLEEKLNKDNDYQNMIINKLPELYSQNNGLMGTSENKYEKGMYIALSMCNIMKSLENIIRSEDFKNKYIFRFNDIIVRGYNHRGAISELSKYLDVCDRYGGYVGVEEYLEHKQRSVQVYFNSTDYDHIIKEYYKNVIGTYSDGKWNFSHIENMVDSMRIMSGKKNQGFLLVGKIKSTLAQALAFERLGNAEFYFKQAIDEMGGDKGNKDITLSYLLHHYCDMAEKTDFDLYKNKFEEEAVNYFDIPSGTIDIKTLDIIFDRIIGGIGRVSELRFSLYLFVKAIRVFYLPVFKEESEFITLIDKMSSGIKEHSKTINDLIHPWELIYKNMYEMLDEIGSTDKSFYFDRIIDGLRIKTNGPTIAAIITKFKLDNINDYKLDKMEQDMLLEIYGVDKIEGMKGSELKEMLKQKLTYMYN